MIDRIKKGIAELQPQMVQWRRHLHAHPELSFQEHGTAAYVTNILEAEGIEVRKGVGKLKPELEGTGVVAYVRGEMAISDKCIALRGDMDALPIQEIGKEGYCSKVPGVMHACGHDAHTTMVLGAGIALHRLRKKWSGTVMLVFQPGEEKEPGGASLLIKEGVFKNPKPHGIIGQHVTPELPIGKVGFRTGPFMAAADELYITVVGKGGHAAQPHLLIDPILIASHLLVALQQVVSRRNQPGRPMVLSFGKVIAQGATNVIPDRVEIAGTLRTFDEAWRAELHTLLPQISMDLAKSMGGSVEFNLVKGSPAVVNDEALTDRVRNAAVDLFGEENIVEMPIRMGAEDFAYYTQVMPGCFYRIGTGNPKKEGTQKGVHTPQFDIDEDALANGASVMGWAALNELLPLVD